MKTQLILGLLLISLSVYSQADQGMMTDTASIANRIAAMDYSKSDLISKSRRLLLQDFNEGNRQEVAKTMQYLANQIDDEYHLSLWNTERYLLMYWLGDYSDILLSIQFAVADTAKRQRPSVYPPDRVLETSLVNGIKNLYYDEIVADYGSLHFSPDSNDFLNLFLNYLLGTVSLDEQNRLSDNFIQNYPYSPLAEATKRYISYKFAKSDFGYGILLGGGMHLASGPVTDWISQPGGMNMDLNFYYKKIHLGLSIVTSFGRVQKEFNIKPGNKLWEAGKRIDLSKISINTGFKAFEYKRLDLTPFAGISFNSASYPYDAEKDEPALQNLKLKTSCSPVVGLDVNVRLNKGMPAPYTSAYPYYYPSLMYPEYILGLKAAYYPNVINAQGGEMRGNTWFVGLFFKMNFFGLKRIY